MFSHKQLNDTLTAVQDLFERLSGCPFYPHQQIARTIHDNWQNSTGERTEGFDSDAVYVMVKDSEMTPPRWSMLRTLSDILHFELTEHDKGFDILNLGEAPVRVSVVKRHYKFLDNPNITFWGVSEYLMPNGFEDYWKARNLIQ